MSVIKIMTWNISWEAMKGELGRTGVDGTKCWKGGKNVCVENVINKIVEVKDDTNMGLDFILLQEASVVQHPLQAKLGKDYDHIYYENGSPGMEESSIIFYNKTKFTIKEKAITGGFHYGRPFIIAKFQYITNGQNILVINLHGSQGGKLIEKKKGILTGKELADYLDYLNYYRLGDVRTHDYTGRDISRNPRVDLIDLPIIIGGDFNLPISGTRKILDQTFSTIGDRDTCCDNDFEGNRLYSKIDHILINDKLTFKGRVKYPRVNDNKYSDHIPIYAEINMPIVVAPVAHIFAPGVVAPRVSPKKYGFDFDGVIHKSVTIPDLNGQRHPNSTILVKNDQIFSKIEEYLTAGHSIEIISSRWDQSIIKPYLLQNSIICNSNETRITVNMKAKGALKHEIVAPSGFIEFYDDSVNVLTDIMLELRKRGITTMKLFLVRPELNDFIEVVSIAQLRYELIKLNVILLCNKSIENKMDAHYIKLKEQINILMADP